MLIIILFIIALILLALAASGVIAHPRVSLGWAGVFFAVLAVFLPSVGVR